METAPLTLAHTHARNAVLETKRQNPVAASEEHDLAAAEFAAAAQGTSDEEALRILQLLEQHHKKLGQILKSRHEKPKLETTTNTSPPGPEPTVIKSADVEKKETFSINATETTIHPPRLSRTLRSNARDLSSSIASNLASARGIPNPNQRKPIAISPLVSNQNADGQFSQEDARRRSLSTQGFAGNGSPPANKQIETKPSWAPPLKVSGDHTEDVDKQPVDAPFQQFYNALESLKSKLNPALAFAGLPLTAPAAPPVDVSTDKPQPSPKPTRKSQHPEPQPTPAVDYSQLISRAALRAVNSNNSANSPYNPSESFYVVPTTGGTTSYADIMNRADREESRILRHHRQLSNLSDDHFVDAPSMILPHQTQPTNKTRRGTNEPKINGKTMEEISLENEALKHMYDKLSKRLHVFEMSAQTSSAALAQSIRSLQRSPLVTPLATPETSRGNPSRKSEADPHDSMARRIAELEDILRKSDARARKKDEENAKLRETIVKYRDKWENLKAGAKARREGQKDRGTRRGSDGVKATADAVRGESAAQGAANAGDATGP